MRLTIAKFTNKLGMKRLTNRILEHKFGSVIGKVSQNGLQVFSQCTDKNTKVITVLDKDLFIYSKLKVKKRNNEVIKTTCTFYDKFGQILKKREMAVNFKSIFHTIFDARTGDCAQWNYHKATGAISIKNAGETGLIDDIVSIVNTKTKTL